LSVERKILEAICKKPEGKEILDKFLEFEGEWKADDLGAEWREIPALGVLLRRLAEKGILRVTLRTRSSTYYRLSASVTTILM